MGASLFVTATTFCNGQSMTNKVYTTPALPLAYKPRHHLALDLQWSVHDPNAKGGAIVRVLRAEELTGEPVFQVFAAVSGFWEPLHGNAALPMNHLADLSNPQIGQHTASTRVYVQNARVHFSGGTGGFNTTWHGITLPAEDFTDENVLEITFFGRGFTLDDAKLCWKPSGTIFITR